MSVLEVVSILFQLFPQDPSRACSDRKDSEFVLIVLCPGLFPSHLPTQLHS